MPVPQLASALGAACAWPPTGTQTAHKPAGGFIACPVDYLTLPWWVYQQGAMGFDTLRVWLGTLELVEKRCCTVPEAPVHYGPEELRRLLRAPRLAPVQEAVQRLENLGLLAWSPQGIQFLPQAQALREALTQDGYQTLQAQLPPGLRWVPVPRRLLVWLAQEGQPGLIATACGVRLRCMRYKARQCVAGGRVAAPWIATVFGVAERTVQRALQTLQGCGWLARLVGPPARERPHGRYTVINLAWERPRATGEPRDTRTVAATTSPETPATMPCRTLSPLQGAGGGTLSPVAAQASPITPEKTDGCADARAALLQPFQEEGLDPEPTGCGPTGAATREEHEEEDSRTPPAAPPDDEPVIDDDYAAATARLLAQGLDPAFLIRPVVLAEVQRVRAEVARGPAVVREQATEGPAATQVMTAPTVQLPAPSGCPPAPRLLQAPSAPVVPACTRLPTWTPPPTLRDVTVTDLGDVRRLLALHEQARARGWLRGGEAEQLNMVAAAVHARRVGQAPCRLFVALLRDRRWEVITQEDEDRARMLLREHADGPCRRGTRAPAAVPARPLSDDARVVLLAPQVLRQAGWRGAPFLGVKLQDPTWTRARWAQAQAELTQWRLRQAQARRHGSDLAPLAVPWVSGEGRDTEDVAETDDEPQQGQTPQEDSMREPTGPQSNGTRPDDRRPSGHPADDLARLEAILQQLQHMLEDHDDGPRWVLMQMTHEAVARAHSLLHGWQVQQAMTQVCLTRWQQTLQALETVGVALPVPGRDTPRRAAAPRAVVGRARGGVPDGPDVGGRHLDQGTRCAVASPEAPTRPVSVPEEAGPPCTEACGDGSAWQIGLLILEVSHDTPSL